MAEIHRVIANLKTALESGAAPHAAAASTPIPVTPAAHRAELASAMARELEAVGGRFLGILTPAQTIARITALATEISAHSVALGEGLTIDMGAAGEALERAGFKVIRTLPVADTERQAVRSSVAGAELGIAEADYAIASTGKLAVVSTDVRPSSLTLLPPASLIVVDIDRIMPDVASVLAAIGPESLAANRMTLITGPSRTADIEKRIVLGVHGPKSLDVIVVWPHDD